MASAPGRICRSILIAESDLAVVHVISTILRLNGHVTYSVHDGDAVLDKLAEVRPRLILMAMRLPVIDGVSACRRIRAVSNVPIIMLSALDDQKDVARALEAGADDYVRMPFGADELAARVNAVLRRASPAGTGTEVFECGPLTLDAARHVVRVENAELALSATEFAVLACLMRNVDRALTYEQLLEAVWGAGYVDSRHTLRVTMSRLRRKLRPAARELIETLPRVGYRMRCTAHAA